MIFRLAVVCTVSVAVVACGVSGLPTGAGVGAHPTLPPPSRSLIPTIHVAIAIGWPSGATPVAAPGMTVQAFASGLAHPRFVYALPDGDVLVAETNAIWTAR